MKVDALPATWLIAGAAIVAGLAWLALRRHDGESLAGAAGAAVGQAAVDVAAGAVLGVGDAIGVPRTDKTECQRAQEAGDWWAASFACPAGDFLSGAWRAITD